MEITILIIKATAFWLCSNTYLGVRFDSVFNVWQICEVDKWESQTKVGSYSLKVSEIIMWLIEVFHLYVRAEPE